jgi:hypothetical protein
MDTIENRDLTRKLLVELREWQKPLSVGASILVQPKFSGVVNPITVPGYDDPEQIEYHLKLLVKNGLIESHVETGEPQIGIYFSNLTEAGRHRALGLDI